MQTKILFTFYFLLFTFYLKSQNLVPNESFEDTLSCPFSTSEIYKAVPWFQPLVNASTSDYYNSCSGSFLGVPDNAAGYQPALTGGAYAGIAFYLQGGGGNSDYREYIEVKLIDSLKAGKKYCVSFYVSLSNYAQYAINSTGIYFSKDSVLINSFPPYLLYMQAQIQNPPGRMLDDTLNWMLISDTMVAAGGEKFITIGNFKPDSLIDSSYVGGGGGSYYYIDDVSVVLCDSGNSVQAFDAQNLKFKVYPNPADQMAVVSWQLEREAHVLLSVYDIIGNKTAEIVNETMFAGPHEKKFDPSLLSTGIYFCKLEIDGQWATTQKLVVIR